MKPSKKITSSLEEFLHSLKDILLSPPSTETVDVSPSKVKRADSLASLAYMFMHPSALNIGRHFTHIHPLIFFQLCDGLSLLPKKVRYPLTLDLSNVKGKFHFAPPSGIKVVGSYLVGTMIKPDLCADLALYIPQVRNLSLHETKAPCTFILFFGPFPKDSSHALHLALNEVPYDIHS